MSLGDIMKKIILFLVVFLLSINIAYAEETNNYIKNGTFENVGTYKYGSDSYTDRIVGIDGSSVLAIWPRHSHIVGFNNNSHSGNLSLGLKQINP